MTASTEGDFGDAIYVCGALHGIPKGPHTFLVERTDWRHGSHTALRSDEAVENFIRVIKPLMDRQGYIKEFRAALKDEPIDWHSGDFRRAGLHYTGMSLFESHVTHLFSARPQPRPITGEKKWLTADPSPVSRGAVVINRTSRYQNPHFPWAEILEHYGSRIIFVGTAKEHLAFCDHYGKVNYVETPDLWELARIIAGSSLFIGNQSSANAIAEGLKHHSIQETSLHIPDCIWRRKNAQHCYDGGVLLPDVSGSGSRQIIRKTLRLSNLNTAMGPPGMWQYPGIPGRTPDFDHLCRQVSSIRKDLASMEEVRKEVLLKTIERCPDWAQTMDHEFKTVRSALIRAGYTTLN